MERYLLGIICIYSIIILDSLFFNVAIFDASGAKTCEESPCVVRFDAGLQKSSKNMKKRMCETDFKQTSKLTSKNETLGIVQNEFLQRFRIERSQVLGVNGRFKFSNSWMSQNTFGSTSYPSHVKMSDPFRNARVSITCNTDPRDCGALKYLFTP